MSITIRHAGDCSIYGAGCVICDCGALREAVRSGGLSFNDEAWEKWELHCEAIYRLSAEEQQKALSKEGIIPVRKDLACPKCGSTNIGQHRMTTGPIWCDSCGFSAPSKELDNPFLRIIAER